MPFHVCYNSIAYKMWFHASGSPAMHQCVQSMPSRAGPPYTEGCASILSCESEVMSSNDTGVAMELITPRTTTCCGNTISSPSVATCSGRVCW